MRDASFDWDLVMFTVGGDQTSRLSDLPPADAVSLRSEGGRPTSATSWGCRRELRQCGHGGGRCLHYESHDLPTSVRSEAFEFAERTCHAAVGQARGVSTGMRVRILPADRERLVRPPSDR